MGDVEQAGLAAGMEMLLQHAGRILHGHVIARERHHLGAERHMQRVKGRAFQGILVVARKHHGALAVPRDDSPTDTIEAPSVAVPESIIPSADAVRA